MTDLVISHESNGNVIHTSRYKMGSKTFELDCIVGNLDLLKAYRDDGREPSQFLLDDIAAYEWILKQEDRVEWSRWYMGYKHDPANNLSAASASSVMDGLHSDWRKPCVPWTSQERY